MSSDKYDVLPIPTHLGSVVDKKENRIKPFIGIYFPAELLEKMKWTENTQLTLAVENGFLKIYQDKEREEIFIYDEPGELVYVPIGEEQ